MKYDNITYKHSMKEAKYTLPEKLAIMLDQETHARLIEVSQKKGLSKSTYIRVLLKEKFNTENGRNDKK